MLSAMLNRATMQVADTTEVSGRVTADSKEKQTMKPTIRRCLALAIAFLGLYLALPDCGLAQNNQDQNDQGTGINLRSRTEPTPSKTVATRPLSPCDRLGSPSGGRTGDFLCQRDPDRPSVVLIRRYDLQASQAQRHLHGQYRWQHVADCDPARPPKANAAF
jgi:hypothetical protein